MYKVSHTFINCFKFKIKSIKISYSSFLMDCRSDDFNYLLVIGYMKKWSAHHSSFVLLFDNISVPFIYHHDDESPLKTYIYNPKICLHDFFSYLKKLTYEFNRASDCYHLQIIFLFLSALLALLYHDRHYICIATLRHRVAYLYHCKLNKVPSFFVILFSTFNYID